MTDKKLLEKMNDSEIPEYMRDVSLSYIFHGLPTGGVLEAVLANDLKGAINSDDMNNLNVIEIYVRFLYSYAPNDCWGSREDVKAWIKKGGLYETS